VRMGINLINTKGNYWQPVKKKNHEPRTQIRTEFLKDPCFRIYVSHVDGKLFDRLEQNIKEHKSIYSVSLGLSELLADFRFKGIFDADQITDGQLAELFTPISAINLKKNEIEIEANKKYFKEKMPIRMNPDRVVEIYDDMIYEPDGKTIKAQVKTYYKLENGENITFF